MLCSPSYWSVCFEGLKEFSVVFAFGTLSCNSMLSVILLNDKKDSETTEQECSEDEGREHDEENRGGKVKALVKILK